MISNTSEQGQANKSPNEGDTAGWTHLCPLVPTLDLPIQSQHLPKLPLGPLGLGAFPFPQFAQPLLELFLALAFRLAKLAEPRVFRVLPLKVAKVGAGRSDGGGQELAIGRQGLVREQRTARSLTGHQ